MAYLSHGQCVFTLNAQTAQAAFGLSMGLASAAAFAVNDLPGGPAVGVSLDGDDDALPHRQVVGVERVPIKHEIVEDGP